MESSGVIILPLLLLLCYFVIGASARTSATTIKPDKNLTEQFRNDLNKELEGKEFEQFFVLQDKLFILASHSNQKLLITFEKEER